MGLAFSHGCASWSYSGFGEFRERLAESIGIALGKMEGYGGRRSWDAVKDDIVPLLHHSDCEGELTSEECAKVAPRLRELVEAWDESHAIRRRSLCYDKDNGRALAEVMVQCAEQGVSLEFC